MKDGKPIDHLINYQVKLEIFEGPLDLLLHLIRKNEVDIFDIPISTVTDQYLEYLDIMKAFNINLAGDFFVMASTLIHIKSKMLLPGYDEDEEDPRDEIIRPLLEYMRLKEVAGELSDREVLGRDVFGRQILPDYRDEVNSEGPLLEVNLFQLMDAFKRVVEARIPGTQLNLQLDEWSLKDKIAQIISQLKEKGFFYFTELFHEDGTIAEFIITFLALLELVHRGLIRVFQPDQEKDIRLEAVEEMQDEGEL